MSKLLTRAGAVRYLQEREFPIAARTLATLESRGGGPTFRTYGAGALRAPGDLLAWAEAGTSPPRQLTAEGDQ